MIWANFMINHQDAVLGYLKNHMSFESSVDLQNAPLLGSFELFPKEALEKSSTILHNEAICKAVSLEKPPKKSAHQVF